MVSFRDQKSLGHAQIGLLWGITSKFPTSIPTPFICGVPPLAVHLFSSYYMTATPV